MAGSATRARGSRRARTPATLVAWLVTTTALLAPVVATPSPAGAQTVEAVDSDDRDAVLAFYRRYFALPSAPPEYTGSVEGCAAGTTSEAFRREELAAVNAARALAGLPEVVEDPELSRLAQAAALLGAANADLSHDPPQTWACWTEEGHEGASRSNLALGVAGVGAIRGYLQDDGVGNVAVGHRRWILDPGLRRIGMGDVVDGEHVPSNALLVISSDSGEGADRVVTWPTPGWFPEELVAPDHRWSISRAGVEWDQATVSVRVDGEPASTDIIDTGFDHLVFTIGRSTAGTTVEATVRAPTDDGDELVHRWEVRMMPANREPQVRDVLLEPVRTTDPAGAVAGRIAAVDPEGEAMRFEVVDQAAAFSVDDGGVVRHRGAPEGSGGSVTIDVVDAGGLRTSAGVVFPLLPPSGAFGDDDGSVHERAADLLAVREIATGCGFGVYCGGDAVTRAQMASFLVRMLDLPATTTDHFHDDDASVHEDAINRLAEAGVALGGGDGRFFPAAPVTRAQMASFLARALALPAAADEGRFEDVSGVHAESIDAVAAAGITVGCDPSGRRYCPGDVVRRDQMASFLARGIRLQEGNPNQAPA